MLGCVTKTPQELSLPPNAESTTYISLHGRKENDRIRIVRICISINPAPHGVLQAIAMGTSDAD
jgi:hypothetical protein